MAKGLTKRQQEILDYVQSYMIEIGFPPSIREIGEQFGIKSLRGVTVHLDALSRKGYIERSNTPRSIRLVHASVRPINMVEYLPLVGEIAAGAPILAEEHIQDRIAVPSQMVRNLKDAFLLRVKGDSMTGDGIHPRDLVVIRPQQTALPNEIVAVMVDNEAAIKRLQVMGDEAHLISSNPSHAPRVVPAEEVRVIGRVIGLIRDYEGNAF
ncbi:MAG: transcriptional repressor LexA [Fimbriimonadaceae bacterium]|nr:transcriptional repressor LexA [Fimbriimonadaceae bacterium]